MARHRRKKVSTSDEAEKKKASFYPVEDLIFKSRSDYKYYLKLCEKLDEGLIESFDPSSLLVPQDESEYTDSNDETKYKARKIVINGEKLDSRLEADYYLHLLELKKQGEIVDFKLKPKFQLQPAFTKNGKKIRAIDYIADFSVDYPDGNVEIIDTKGIVTADFALKKKIFEYNFPDLELRVLKYVKSMGGWIEHDEHKSIKKQQKRQ